MRENKAEQVQISQLSFEFHWKFANQWQDQLLVSEEKPVQFRDNYWENGKRRWLSDLSTYLLV